MESYLFNEQNSIISVSTKDSNNNNNSKVLEEKKELKKEKGPKLKSFIHLEHIETFYEKSFLLEKIIKLINIIIKENEKKYFDNNPNNNNNNNNINVEENKKFLIKKLPKISLKDYIFRIDRYLDPEISTFIISLIYIQRIYLSGIFINEFNKFKLIIIAINLAKKFNEDANFNNKFTSIISGININKINELEEIFLLKINFHLWVNEDEFEKYCSEFVKKLIE